MRSTRTMKIVAIAAAVAASLVGTATAASAATAVTAVSVSATPFTPGATATYTISFRTSPTGALTIGSGQITVSGFNGTLPSLNTDYTVDSAGKSAVATAVSGGGSTVTITSPVAVKASTLGTIVTVTVAGVTNPSPGVPTNYTASVFTSADTTPTASGSYTITGATPLNLVPSGGNGQTAQVGTAFPTHLGASIKDTAVPPNPVLEGNVPVTFTVVPASAGTFTTSTGNSSTVVVMTGGTGVATSPVLTPTGTAGPFTVTATATSPALATATFNEVSTAVPVVTPPPPPPPPPANSPSDHGYWLVGGDGGIFTFGSAAFYGSTGSMPLSRPVVGITPTSSRQGYWLDAADGGIFAFGDAGFYGSIPGLGILPAGSREVGASWPHRWWAWCRRPTATATSWWRPTVASSLSVTPCSPDRARPSVGARERPWP